MVFDLDFANDIILSCLFFSFLWTYTFLHNFLIQLYNS